MTYNANGLIVLFGGAIAYYLGSRGKIEVLGNVTDKIIKTSNNLLGSELMPRGIRNNNPLNIEKNNTAWQGKINGADARFATFVSPEYGIRAGAKILLNYQKLYNLDTIEKIFNRYAPPFENNTNAYAEHMAKSLGIKTTDKISLTKSNLVPLITAMIKHENGVQPYDINTISKGVALA